MPRSWYYRFSEAVAGDPGRKLTRDLQDSSTLVEGLDERLVLDRLRTEDFSYTERVRLQRLLGRALQDSAVLSDNLVVTEPDTTPTTLFEAIWDYDTGDGDDACQIGASGSRIFSDRWNNGPSDRFCSVENDSGFPSQYAMRTDSDSGTGYDLVGEHTAFNASYSGPGDTPQDFALRFYYKHSAGWQGCQSGSHHYESHEWSYGDAWYIRCRDSSSQLLFMAALCENHGSYPWEWPWHTSFSPKTYWYMPEDTWYRVEILYKFNSNTEVRHFPRVYTVTNPGTNNDGSLLYDWDDCGGWAESDTLEDFYDIGGNDDWHAFSDTPDDAWNSVVLGNNGPGQNAGGSWWIAAFKIVDGSDLLHTAESAWVGPHIE